MLIEPDYFSSEALLDRLSEGVRRSNKGVVFMLGSALSQPQSPNQLGIPNVSGVIDLIREEFKGSTLEDFDGKVNKSDQPYQTAFSLLGGHRGSDFISLIIKRAVYKARRPVIGSDASHDPSLSADDSACRHLDLDNSGWNLPDGLRSLGALISKEPKIFGEVVLTTNFDPLIEVAIQRGQHAFYRTTLHRDGNLAQTHGNGCHVVHLHGYWHGSDTLHLPKQLLQERPRLKASLSHLLAGKTVVVLGYGGWDDVFMQALTATTIDDQATTDVLWASFGDGPLPNRLTSILEPGIDRGRVYLYRGIDSNSFLPALAARWHAQAVSAPEIDIIDKKKLADVAPKTSVSVYQPTVVVSSKELGYPPQLEIAIIRSHDIEIIKKNTSGVMYLTGIGGSGKSALAAEYFKNPPFEAELKIWKDCKEESERLEKQIVDLVYLLYDGRVSQADLAKRIFKDIVYLFVAAMRNISFLFVLDNVDHYIDLETREPIGALALFCDAVKLSCSKGMLLLTCRPDISAISERVSAKRIEGFDLQDAVELFKLRGATADYESIERAHSFTGGHVFWLDLLAAQVARLYPQRKLIDFIEDSSSDFSEIPLMTLNSIWQSLKSRERTVLRTLASTVRPTNIGELADYLAGKQNFKDINRAISSLKGLSLLVSKNSDSGAATFELHPIIKAFIKRNFGADDQNSFTQMVLKVYKNMFGLTSSKLPRHPEALLLTYWCEGAELYTAVGEYKRAMHVLYVLRDAVREGGQTRDYVRVMRLMLDYIAWPALMQSEYFTEIFDTFIEILALSGEADDCEAYLGRYSGIIVSKEARYVHLCHLRCYSHWLRKDFVNAIKWGSEGVRLVKQSHVDTRFTSAHSLALAQRDGGDPDAALKFFLHDYSLDEVLAGECDGEDEAFFGNIGRCLQMMGQIEPALRCYYLSAKVLDRGDAPRLENKAYLRQWVGELLLSRGDNRGVGILREALEMWVLLSPQKVEEISSLLDETSDLPYGVAIPSPKGQIWKHWISEARTEFATSKTFSQKGVGSTV